jgi:hypothetical protein
MVSRFSVCDLFHGCTFIFCPLLPDTAPADCCSLPARPEVSLPVFKTSSAFSV